ncbi:MULTISPECIES: contact-dependent growth inhibition system immunity protein [Ralstonia solanacearum species complex]|uniref:contact-dependent growth inhibition system immunity protein n=1 Tax=Ralstonia solanacearum species complex TaxID=3116862 RepID=UPI000E576B3F|nr:contact-dependent growth inhibition system immunity protein [Ralstonia solanacearum]BEU70513.1 hypothetical protein MAFF211271_00680 [Ralstonia pseudosolanacearum]AXV75563.1 hypothetical protein CJO76_00335 [Ralstonia solanacearum]AXV89563.1 hypothetical protein CJO79_00335 [Ralstonia solanacearum]AXW17771.1 hypothetical protein CJO85_00335 [Ralstonia solanacearum]AXW60640.1 hypothetical protein CJO94_00315 [Ralstonia solanacearum]
MCPDEYYELWQLISLFGEDFDLFGETIEEIVTSYKKGCSKDLQGKIIIQIDKFMADNKENLDGAFVDSFGLQCAPVLWGHTTASFLDVLKTLMQ